MLDANCWHARHLKYHPRVQDDVRVPHGSVSVVFLAGGSGKRMKVHSHT